MRRKDSEVSVFPGSHSVGSRCVPESFDQGHFSSQGGSVSKILFFQVRLTALSHVPLGWVLADLLLLSLSNFPIACGSPTTQPHLYRISFLNKLLWQ